MSFFEIEGGRRLSGELTVQGAKNSVLPILAAALLAPGESVIHNCPDLSDVNATLEILRRLGCKTRRVGETVTVDARAPTAACVPEELTRKLRSSVVFLGALLARMGEGELAFPGGCDLGSRPIDLHLSALRQLGAELREEGGCLRCKGGRRMRGREICLSIPSVGATENIMLAACGCSGTTKIVGAAREPEIEDLQTFLRRMGADVTGAGGSVIVIQGGKTLHAAEHTVMGDRIAAATYLSAAAAAGGEVRLSGIEGRHLTAVLTALEEAGCRVRCADARLYLSGDGQIRCVRPIRTAPHPGFPTDAQALLMAVLAGGAGSTMFVENMFDSRYRHVDELARMGADIQVEGRVAVVNGAGRLHGASVRSTDLRGGAALVVAALGAEGITYVHDLRHIRRGYDALEEKLSALGAHIRAVP